MTIQQRAEELYPNDDITDFIGKEHYIKGAEEWYIKGKESMDFYVTERSRLIDENNALIEEKEELAARVKEIEKREAETVLSALDYQKQEHDQEMKDFAEWVSDKGFDWHPSLNIWLPMNGYANPKHTTSELLELFRKSKTTK